MKRQKLNFNLLPKIYWIVVLLFGLNLPAALATTPSEVSKGALTIPGTSQTSEYLTLSQSGTILENDETTLEWQSDGDLILYFYGEEVLWHTNTAGEGNLLVYQASDGVFMIKNQSGSVIWTTSEGADQLILQSDRNLELVASSDADDPVWSSGTGLSYLSTDGTQTVDYDEEAAQDFLVPYNSGYNYINLLAEGADGGKKDVSGTGLTAKAGAGATIEGTFEIGDGDDMIPEGSIIRMIIGEKGPTRTGSTTSAGAGGGGTAILFKKPDEPEWELLLVAGGGGGAYSTCCGSKSEGKSATTSESGSSGQGYAGGSGGSNGNEGNMPYSYSEYDGTPGAGAYGDYDDYSQAGWSGGDKDQTILPTGGDGGGYSTKKGGWGFGGGGSGGIGGGGGGGYSGGGTGQSYYGGGGGGSYVNSMAYESNKTQNSSTTSTSNGFVQYSFECIGGSSANLNVECKSISITIEGSAVAVTAEELASNSTVSDCFSITSYTYSSGSTSKKFRCSDSGIKTYQITVTASDGTSGSCYGGVTITSECPPTISCLESTTVEVDASIDAESLIESADNADTYAFDDGASSRIYTCDQIDNTFTETLTVTNSYGSSTCEVAVTVENTSSNSASTWTGTESSDWEEPCNWSTYAVPSSSTEVTIPTTSNDPVISANTSVKSLEIEADASLTIEHTYTLTIDNYADIGATVYGTLTNNGALKIDNTGSSALVASGSDAQINLYGDTYIGLTSGNIGGAGIMLEDGANLNITNTGDDNKPYLIIDYTASYGILINNSTMNATLEQTTKPQVMVRIGSNSIGENGLALAGSSSYINSGAELEIGNATRGIEIASTATFENTADGQVTIGELGPLSKNGIYLAGSFSNAGTVTIENASYPELFGGENWDNTNGSLMVDGKTFGLSSIDGTLAPGSSLGTLTTDANLELVGTLEIEVEGTTAGTEYDVLEVNGDLTLTGASLSTDISYTANQDDRIVFITYSGSLSGTFSTDLPSDWELDYSVSGEIAIVYSATN